MSASVRVYSSVCVLTALSGKTVVGALAAVQFVRASVEPIGSSQSSNTCSHQLGCLKANKLDDPAFDQFVCASSLLAAAQAIKSNPY